MAWKRKLTWIALVLVGSVVVLSVGGYLVLRSARFHGYLRGQIEKRASEATGAEVRIQNFAIHVSQLAADAYGITVGGNQPVSARPLVQADELRIRLKIISLLRKKIDLNEIVLQHPVVNLRVSKDGTTNLPVIPKSSSNTSTNPFDLGIQHVLLENGEIYYNDVKTSLQAELHDVQVEIKAQVVGKSYDGNVSYRDGKILYGDTKPLAHDLSASFNATPSEFTLQPLVLTVSSSTIELKGKVQNYSQPSASGSYRVTIHPQDERAALRNAAIPAGEVTLAGSMRYQQQVNVPFIRALYLGGVLMGRELAVSTVDFNSVVRNIHGEFKLADANLDVHGLEADLLGGHVMARAAMQNLDGNSAAKVHASVNAISLNAANAGLRKARLNPMPIDGQISGTADAAWSGNVENIKARSDITLNAALTRSRSGSTPVPLDGAAHVKYDGRTAMARFTEPSVH